MAKDGDERLCTQAEVDGLVRQAVEQAVGPLLERVAALESKIARLTRDSRTSSKPPSSDVVKQPPPANPKARARSGSRAGRRGIQTDRPAAA